MFLAFPIKPSCITSQAASTTTYNKGFTEELSRRFDSTEGAGVGHVWVAYEILGVDWQTMK